LLEGFVDTGGETIEVLTRFELDKINLDSMFYIFEDFNQDWLTHHHLSGKMTSTVTADMSFTRNLEFIPQSLVADMNVAIRGGELKNFEPMLLLAPYLPKDNLKHFRFSDLTNDIHIEDQTVYLPQMQINSNVTNILIGGTHTFDQHIHYKIVAPIINTPKIDKDEMFGAIEDDGTNVPRIHLLLTGTTDDYKISLDKQGTKNQVISDLKNEVKELKEAFQNKQKEKKKALKLEEDEYFDWDY
ncbi:MAG: AsmA-like C-terminal region-containing protein, partial [Cyclobacteriaceae bacterium]|nr:AsmA-like C-terminal region-containing protein [Cyclobacteriaceae bacterium]